MYHTFIYNLEAIVNTDLLLSFTEISTFLNYLNEPKNKMNQTKLLKFKALHLLHSFLTN